MEKGYKKSVNIAITGPESTGKSTLTSYLAQVLNGREIPEYARDYILNLGRPYKYSDIEHIAEYQINTYVNLTSENSGILFFDTWLIITKIWFREVYARVPDWLISALNTYKMDYYLVCSPDIEWIKDEVRENGGEKRLKLFDMYISEIENLKVPYKIIKGEDQQRLLSAKAAIGVFLQALNVKSIVINR